MQRRIVMFFLIPCCLILLAWAATDKPIQYSSDELGGDRLRLLAEVADDELNLLVAGATDGEEPRRLRRKECYFVGELQEKQTISDISKIIREAGGKVVLVERIVEELGSYLVYVPPLDSRSEANALIEKLGEDGVDGSLIRDEPYVNGVSIGLFRSERNAAALFEKVRGLGYEVRRRRLPVETSLHGVQVIVPESIIIEESFWQEMRNQNANLQVEEKYCDEVASVINFQ